MASEDGKPAEAVATRVKRDDQYAQVAVQVRPVRRSDVGDNLLLVTFRDLEMEADATVSRPEVSLEEESAVEQLEWELAQTIEEMGAANEELKASNEEILSMNEELQSSNEELETSQEELQSLNEELSTVNAELQAKLAENAEGIITSANPAAERILGRTLDELRGSTLYDDYWECYHEDGSKVPVDERPIAVACRTGKAVYDVVLGIRTPYDADLRWLSITAIPHFREGGRRLIGCMQRSLT